MNNDIYCSRCRTEIGNHIRFCPKCGNENKKNTKFKNKKNRFVKILIPIMIVTIVLLSGLYVFKGKDNDTANIVNTEVPSPSLLPFNENGKWGYMDTNGKVEISPKYDFAGSFKEGLAVVMIDGKYGYINEKDEVIIDIEYGDVGSLEPEVEHSDYDFNNGLVGVYKNNKYYMMDNTGEIVTKEYVDTSFASYELFLGSYGDTSEFSSYAYDKYHSLSEGMSIYKDSTNEKYGYVDEDGVVVIKAQFDWAWEFSEGLGAVVKDGLLGFVNKDGDLVIDYQFEANSDKVAHTEFSEGLIPVKKDGKYGYINKKGKFVIENKYEYAGQFVNGKAPVVLKEEDISANIDYSQNEYVVELTKVSYIDTKGNIVIEGLNLPIYYDYSREEDFSNGLLPVYKDGKIAYIDEDNNVVSEYIFDWGTSFVGSSARVILDDESVWINDKFEVIVPYQGTMEIEEYLDYKEI